MKLKTLAAASTAWIAALALLAASGFTLSAAYMGREVSCLFDIVREVRSIMQLEVHLLSHERESARIALTQLPEHIRARDAARRELSRWLEDAREQPITADSADVFEAAEREIERYLAAHAQTEGHPAADTSDAEVSHDEVDRTFAALERLLAARLDEARIARERVEKVNRLSELVSVGAAGVLLAGVLVALWQLRRCVYRPLLSIRAAIDSYGAGSHDARAPQRGLDELREIAVAFNEMAAALAEQRKRQLGILASVAHDLRNPLAALKLTVDGLRPDRPLPPEERLRLMLARIGKEAARCDRMLADLMDTARLEGGELELRRETRDARGRRGLHRGLGPRGGDRARRPTTAVRALFPRAVVEPRGPGRRPRPVGRAPHRRGARRVHRGDERRRQGLDLHPAPAVRVERAARVGWGRASRAA